MQHWPINPEESVSIHQVASLYGVSVRQIRRWVQIGKVLQPEHKGRFSWRAGDIMDYRRAWNAVKANRRLAKLSRGADKRGQTRTNAPNTEKPSSKRAKAD